MAMTLDGSNGVTFNDSSLQGAAASPYVLKNRIINGAMVVDQRNAGASTTATSGSVTYITDRWAVYSVGSNVTCQQVAGPNTYDKAEQLLPLTGNTAVVFLQRIESKNCLDLINKTVTVSGQIYIDSISGVSCSVSGFAATSTDSNYATAISGFSVSLTAGSYVSFSGQLSLPSTAYNGIEIDIVFNGVAGRTIKVTNVQLEIGTSATPFERRLYNQELANCQRYFAKTFPQSVAVGQNSGDFNSLYNIAQVNNLSFASVWKLPVTMRANPTITTFSPNAANANWSPNATTPTAVVATASQELAVINGTTSTTAGNGYYIHASASIEL
jgi:hypothetical protein